MSIVLNCFSTDGEKQGAAVFIWLWEWMNNFLQLVERVGVWVRLLSSPGVLSGSNSSLGISYRGLCSFICTGGDDNSVDAESRSNRDSLVFKEKLLRQGIWWRDFTHISLTQHTHPDHLKTQVGLPVFFPCSRATQQSSLEERDNLSVKAFPIWDLNQVDFQSQTFFPSLFNHLLHFPNLFTIVVNRRK